MPHCHPTFLVLDLGLDIVDGVATLDLEGDGLPGQRLHEDLHLAGPGCSRCSFLCSRRRLLRVLKRRRRRRVRVFIRGCGGFLGFGTRESEMGR